MKRVRFQFGVRSPAEPEAFGADAAFAVAAFEGPAPAVTADVELLRQDPPLSDLDETILLLHTAAEVEHSLLAQYLYAAYSLPESGVEGDWRDAIVEIAREEMAHLLSVQNVLLALAGPLNFEREDYPFRTFYPFPFQLEPFSLRSAARYVLAEMPDASVIPPDLGFDFAQVQADAGVHPGEPPVNRVGLLYAQLVKLVSGLDPAAFAVDSQGLQADPQEWGAAAHHFVLDIVSSREKARELLMAIGEQGEGPTEPTAGLSSHFRRFLAIYQQMKQYPAAAVRPLPTNPTTSDPNAAGYLSNPRARSWAHLLNHHYRSLLALLAHQLGLRRDVPAEKQARNMLRTWTRDEMRWLREGASELMLLPQHEPPRTDAGGTTLLAAIPFELPYSLSLPQRPIDRWRHHQRLAQDSRALIGPLLLAFPTSTLLKELDTWEADRLQLIASQIQAAS